MKALILIALLSICLAESYSQNLTSGNRRLPGDALFLRDYFTTPFQGKNKYGDIDGSPFVDDNWMLARLYIDSIQFFDSVKIRINLFENRIHYLNDDNEEFQAYNRFREIQVIDRSSKLFGAVFRSDFYEEPNIYFQVITDGPKVQLLQKTKVERWVTKAAFEESKTVFQQSKELFFAMHNNLFNQNKDCKALDELIMNNKDLLQFIKDNELKCNKEADMKRIVNFINSK